MGVILTTQRGLPARVLEHLRSGGPDYTTQIARSLDSTTAAVAGAITTLRRRELVHVDRLEPTGANHRVYYAAGAITGRGRVTELVAAIEQEVRPGSPINWAEVAQAAAEIATIASRRTAGGEGAC